ncbi:hypothetical protein HG536_0F02200 [Torulaspora globosa]|uniref:Uncharacterized protein n=1 Tax=Torulaspora globosa TaxID=48254 RepID=A0A7G3ZK59_9SACH|nr:uncharacterized protein HG536_0F02200 [Torulaspora globosa]QLL33895.1 hypothetical protein HG536_0F02200 [Torulaspora globosa]
MLEDSAAVYVTDLKLVLLGESSVGKSSIVTRYITGSFQKTNATIGAAFTTKTLEFPGADGIRKKVNLEIWDTAGQERYRSMAPMYFRNTDIALVVFDVTKPESLRKAQSWIDELNSYFDQDRREEVLIKLVGNKMDLDHPPTTTIGELPLYLVSAKTGEGIDELIEDLVRQVPMSKYKKVETSTESKNAVHLDLHRNTRMGSACC